MRIFNFVMLIVASGVPRRLKRHRHHHSPPHKALVTCPCHNNRDCGCGGSDWPAIVKGVLPVGLLDAPAPSSPQTTTIKVTDQTLLTVYKGHDMSDRDGVANYGDLIQDFRQGWSLWPANDAGQHVVNYIIDDSVGNCERSTVTVALSVLAQNSCIKFNPISQSLYLASGGKDPALHITDSGTGCFASLGYQSPGENLVNIGAGCVNVGTVLHLVMHSLGMLHEHQRSDRDNYVEIVSTNIDSNRIGGNAGTTKFDAVFGKVDSTNEKKSLWSNVTESKPYDYSSIMHNGPCHYSISEEFGGGAGGCALEPSLRPNPGKSASTYIGSMDAIGNRATLSAGDVYMLSQLYSCPVGIIPSEVVIRSVDSVPTTGNSTAPTETGTAIDTGNSTTASSVTTTTYEEEEEEENFDTAVDSTEVYEEIVGDTNSTTASAEEDFWPAEPVPVTLSDAPWLLAGPDPNDASTPETSLCTAGDAAGFTWTDKAALGRAPKEIMKSVATKTGDSFTALAPTENPNQQLVFNNFFSEATSQRMMYLAIGGIATLVLLSGIVIFFIYKRRKMNRTGLKAVIEQGGPEGDAGVPLLSSLSSRPRDRTDPDALSESGEEGGRHHETGDTTDSEVYADIINDDNFDVTNSRSQSAAESGSPSPEESGPFIRAAGLV